MNNNEEEKYIERPDFSQIKEGQKVFQGYILDANNNVIGPIPKKRYSSHEEYLADLKNRQNTKESAREEQEIYLWKDIDAMKFPDDMWRVKNLVPKYGMVILASVSGEGKTWIALELARCISTGFNFLGEGQFKTIQAKVLYIDAENTQSEIQRRGRQLSFTDTDQLLFRTVDQLNLNTDEGYEDLKSLVDEKDINVIIVDTFRAVAGGLKEEKAEEVREFFNRFKELKEKAISVVWLDHYRKPSNFEGKVPKKEFLFGSQDKTASIEVLLMMKKEENEIAVYQRKNRLGREIDPFKITLSDETREDGSTKTNISFGGGFDEKESKKEIAKEFILNILKDNPKTTPEIIDILYKEKKVAERNVREALRELMSEGIIDKHKNGRKDEYFLMGTTDDDLLNGFSF